VSEAENNKRPVLLEGYGITTNEGKIVVWTQIDWHKMEGRFRIFNSREDLESWANSVYQTHGQGD
jgi:hypothetical protein